MTKPYYYLIDHMHQTYPVSMEQWARSNLDENWTRVGHTIFNQEDIVVSTVFLGLDHRFLGEGDPILFETMIFGGSLDQWQDRYTSWTDAKLGHNAAVTMVAKLLEEARNGKTEVT